MYSQVDLFQPISNKTGLSVKVQNKLARYESGNKYCNVRPVVVGDLSGSMVGNELHVNLPGEECPVIYKYKSSGTDENNGFTWFGELYNKSQKCSGGEFLYYRHEDKVYGRLQTEDAAYEFKDIGDGKSVLYCENIDDTGGSTDWVCAFDPGNTDGLVVKPEEDSKNEEPCLSRGKVNLLVVFTPEAEAEDPDIEASIQLAVAQMKQALRGALIDPDDLRIDLTGILPFNYDEPLGNMNIDLALTELNDGRLDNLMNVETTSDLVCVITADVFGNTGGVAFPASIERRVSIATVGQLTGLRALAHEVGHQLGARHNVTPAEPAQLDGAHGFTWITALNKRRSTILGQLTFGFPSSPEGKLRKRGRRMVTYYSTPEVVLADNTIGSVDVNNVARRFSETGPIVAQLNPNSPVDYGFAAWVNGAFNPCPCEENIYTADFRCAEDNVTVEWHTTANGLDFTYQGGGNSFEYIPSCSEVDNVTIRLTTTDGTSTFVSSKSVSSSPDGGFNCGNKKSAAKLSSGKKSTEEVSTLVYPNPLTTEGVLNVQVGAEYIGGEIALMDFNSRVLFRNSSILHSNCAIDLSMRQIDSGIYFLVVTQVGGYSKVSKIVVL